MTVVTKLNQINSGISFPLNTFTSGNQLAPDVLGLADDGFVCAYNNGDINNGFILLDFYDAAAEQVGIFEIPYDNPAQTDAVGEPSLTQLANGNVLVVWDENSSAGDPAGMRGALFTSDGTVIDRNINLTPGSGTAFRQLDVTALSNGNFVVCYDFGGNERLQIYDAAGNRVLGKAINTVTTGVQADTQFATLAGGGFVAVWTDVNTDQLKYRIFEDDGDARTDEAPIFAFNGKSQAAVAALPDGAWCVAYRDTAWSEPGELGAGISLQVFSAEGVDFNGPIQVNAPSDVDESDPDVTVLDNGFILVTWTRPVGENDHDIMGRLFDARGNALTIDGDADEFVVHESAADSVLSSVAALDGGRYLAAWQSDFTGDGSGGQITGRIRELRRTSDGDEKANRITGDALVDVVFGRDGSDTIRGGDNDDSLFGGDGKDVIFGEGGDDVISGGARIDSLSGGDGNDLIFSSGSTTPLAAETGSGVTGGTGDDTLVGGLGGDSMNGDADQDLIRGELGDDTLRGGAGSDTLLGGEGADRLMGGSSPALGTSAANTLEGGGGDDTLTGDFGVDVLLGGDGDDVLQGLAGGDSLEGGEGSDTLSFEGEVNVAGVTISLLAGTVAGGDATGDSFSGIENLRGSSAADRLIGDDFDNSIDGGGGADTLEGRDGDDTLVSGAGFAPDRLIGGKGRDVLTGSVGEDVFVYLSVRDSQSDPIKRDLITDFGFFEQDDLIDLSAVDAKSGGKDDAFGLVSAFTGAKGQLVVEEIGAGRFLVQGDVDGDKVADLVIEVVTEDPITAASFVL